MFYPHFPDLAALKFAIVPELATHKLHFNITVFSFIYYGHVPMQFEMFNKFYSVFQYPY